MQKVLKSALHRFAVMFLVMILFARVKSLSKGIASTVL